jgi:DNA-3-methyladenine glycosylase
VDLMHSRRPGAKRSEDLASGPGKLTLALGITRAHNGTDLTRGPLVVRAPAEAHRLEIAVTPRIGIRECADWPLRFLIKGNRFVSGVKVNRAH